jgi:PAS domain S-box-containing protein
MEGSFSILIYAGDQNISVRVTNFLIQKENYRQISCTDSYEKFNHEFEPKKWDVVLLCCDFPDDNELNIIQKTRLICPYITLIIISNVCPSNFATQALKLGMIDFYYISIEDIVSLPQRIETALQIKREISHCSKAYEELLRKEQEIKGILDNIQDAYFRTDNLGILTLVNRAGVDMFGYNSAEELIGQNGSILYYNIEDRENLQKILHEEGQITNYIKKGKRKDGSEFWASMNAQVLFDDAGSIIGKEGIIRDISEKKMAIDALIDSETRYRDLTESSPIGIFTTDLEGVIDYENPAMRRILGIPEGEVSATIGLRMSELPNIKNTHFSDLLQNVSKGIPIKDIDLHFESISGSPKIFRINGIPIRNNQGTITGNLLIIQDITEQHKTEEALRESRRQFSSLTESSQDPIYLIDQNCRFLYANQSYIKRYDLTLNDIVGKYYNEFHDQNESTDFTEKVNHVVETGEWITYEHFSSIDNSFFIRTLSPVLGIENGFQVTVVSKDITERKKAEEALIQERKLLRTLIENLPNAVFAKDREYRKVIVNSQHIESVLGHLDHLGLDTNIDILGKTDFEVFPIELADKFFEEDQLAIRDGISVINNLEFGVSRKGEQIWNLVSKIPLRDSNSEIIGMVGITTDITELKNAEQKLLSQKEILENQNEKYSLLNNQYKKLNLDLLKSNEELLEARIRAEESDRLKTSFLQNMSHEIRTPMNAIMGFSELLPIEFDDKERLEKFAKIIHQRSSDLLDIINDILDISKIESGKLPVNLEKFSLKPIFQELEATFNEYRIRINKEQVQFLLSFQCNNEVTEIVSDKVKLKQIFINLIGNAFKFTKKGKIEAGIKLTEKNELIFFVSDTGIGIPKEKQELVFERFMQINDKTASVSGGTGLGLSIVKGLINLLGGKIWLESKPGTGSTFFFTVANGELPCERLKD